MTGADLRLELVLQRLRLMTGADLRLGLVLMRPGLMTGADLTLTGSHYRPMLAHSQPPAHPSQQKTRQSEAQTPETGAGPGGATRTGAAWPAFGSAGMVAPGGDLEAAGLRLGERRGRRHRRRSERVSQVPEQPSQGGVLDRLPHQREHNRDVDVVKPAGREPLTVTRRHRLA